MDLSHLKSMTNELILRSILFNFPCLDGNVPRTIFHCVNISQLIRFARVSNHLADFWFNWWVSTVPELNVVVSVSPLVCLILVLILISLFLR